MDIEEHRAHLPLPNLGRSCPFFSSSAMTRRWLFKKVKLDRWALSSKNKVKSPPSKKIQDMPYMKVALAWSLHDQNRSFGVRDDHLLGGWLLRSYGIYYTEYPRVLEEYSDSNWILDADETNATSEYVFSLGGGIVSWKS
jgi:hypothetical protein